MIRVSQGHQHSISLEVFFKACLFLSQKQLNQIVLYAFKDSIKQTLSSLNLEFDISDDKLIINNLELPYIRPRLDKTESLSSLLAAMNDCKMNDILLTLPTSKDQLSFDDTHNAGYTEFFRNYFKLPYLSMCFKGGSNFYLLLSDHIPLAKVSDYLTNELIDTKLDLTTKGIKKYFSINPESFLAGINPHAGEDGLLGEEERNLKIKNSSYNFLPADTLHFHFKNKINKLIIYSTHDQGLTLFKENHGLLGINITFGLPFLRLSVDHGTAFPLFGKNQANSLGCYHVLIEALKIGTKI